MEDGELIKYSDFKHYSGETFSNLDYAVKQTGFHDDEIIFFLYHQSMGWWEGG